MQPQPPRQGPYPPQAQAAPGGKPVIMRVAGADAKNWVSDLRNFMDRSQYHILPILFIFIFCLVIGIVVCAVLLFDFSSPTPTQWALMILSWLAVIFCFASAIVNKAVYGELLPHAWKK